MICKPSNVDTQAETTQNLATVTHQPEGQQSGEYNLREVSGDLWNPGWKRQRKQTFSLEGIKLLTELQH